MSHRRPFVVGIGGTTEVGSSTEHALRLALAAAETSGAETRMFDGAELSALPHYRKGAQGGQALVDAVRRADGVILASPGYHGSISGLVKNAIDYLEETAKDERVYLDGVPVGLIATAYGWQAGGNTVATLRSIAHALRAWPTPLGACINVSGRILHDGVCDDAYAALQLALVGRQVVQFVRMRLGAEAAIANGVSAVGPV